MFKNKRLLLPLIILIISGCAFKGKNKGIDLYSVFGKETPKDIEQAASRKSDQKGHFEVGNGQFNLVDQGEVVTNYSFDEQDAHKVMFAGLEINEAYGAKVVSYNNTIAFVSLKAPEEHVKDYFNSFVKELGKSDSMHIESIAVATVNDRVKSTLQEAFPGILKAYKGDIPDVLVYPQRLFWKKGNVRYFLTLDPVGDFVNLKIDIITENALNDKIVMGYHVPQ